MIDISSPRHFCAHTFRMHEIRVLDEPAIEIDDVKAAIWSRRQKDGMKPRIGRGQKLPALFGSLRDEGNSARHEHAAMHEVQQRFTDERVAAIFLAERIT